MKTIILSSAVAMAIAGGYGLYDATADVQNGKMIHYQTEAEMAKQAVHASVKTNQKSIIKQQISVPDVNSQTPITSTTSKKRQVKKPAEPELIKLSKMYSRSALFIPPSPEDTMVYNEAVIEDSNEVARKDDL